MSDERKSWRDRDAAKDRSNHRDGPAGGNRPPKKESQAYRAYKSELNKIFEGGGLPEHLKDQLGETELGKRSAAEKTAREALMAELKPRKFLKAFRAYRADFGFPTDNDLLGRLLDTDDDELVLETMETIERLHSEGALKRAAALKARIKSALIAIDEPEVHEKGKALLELL